MGWGKTNILLWFCRIQKRIWAFLERPLDKSAYSKFGPWITVHTQNLTFLFLNQNICCGCLKEQSQQDCSFDYPKLMFKLMDKNIFTILRPKKLVYTT